MLNISSNKLLSNDKSDNDELSFEKFQGSYRKIVSKNRDDKNIYEEQFDFIDNYHQIKVCPEPLTFLHELIKRNSFEERENYLKKQIEKKGKIIEPINDIAFTKYYWNNQTTNGVNLRPGLKGNLEVMYPLRLDDSNVHGLISGVTGSGKSVLLNTMIMNLLYEYPSWELDLFLVDFKKVEFSRYLSLQDKPSPSVNAVGATEEVSYVVSLIKYIYDVMNAREMLFSKLNQTHIKGFREKYDVVLPRVVLIVDEFQQMFLEASNKETAQINEYLTAITKKGRATGIHLLFASQEMSNTLPQNVKMNFQLRMVLPCTKEVSIEVLGNSAGATLEAFHMLANKGSRNAENNIKFLIPFIDTAKEDEQGNTVFVNLLEELKKISSSFSFKKPHKYYEETSTDSIRELVKLKKNRNVQKEIKKIINDSSQYSESIILGPAVTYNSKEIDYESIFIEDSKSNNIACHSPNLHKAAYLLNLLFLNFYFSEKNIDILLLIDLRVFIINIQL